jgi:hypothetical protein
LDYVTVTLAGELLDHGGIQEGIAVRVANLLPFLVLKAYALDERDKAKDSYDVVWILNAYKQGPRSAVKRRFDNRLHRQVAGIVSDGHREGSCRHSPGG